MKVIALILAAGLSHRMGKENKLFLNYRGKSIVHWVIDRVTASRVDKVGIVTGSLSHKGLQSLQSDRIQIIYNNRYKEGMTSSILAGIKMFPHTHYMICLGDQPTIQTSTYNQVIDEFLEKILLDNRAIARPFRGKKAGHPIVFSNAYHSELLRHKKPEGCREIVQENETHLLKVKVEDNGILEDIDTKENYILLNARNG